MRSVLKFLILSLITLLIPGVILGIAYKLDLNDIGIMISQMLVMLVFVLVFTNILKYMKKYELDTQILMNEKRNVSDLKDLRDERKTYKSKAMITSKILSLAYSKEEVENLKKYATTNEDIEHYYSALIDHADKENRQKIKTNRDKFNKRYGKKQKIYPDFKGNIKTAVKWMIFFFALVIIYNIIPKIIGESKVILASFYMLGMLFLAVVMLNTILWIVRSLKSYWASDYII